ncbi:hypothetical protein HPB52_018609 [Rhipicephalus sanguineus]|uniref:Nlr family card domain protein n=1 Tax=Rhipicephalus sanguineus TaxID=34632 RepID=A0A9D4PK90_RHISA|nr:hypothetical protein HPB52_018609 [Rhipicephalus sanguineus]
MDSARSYFSGSSINYRIPCTSSDGRLCHIFADLPLWNEFFWQVGLELRELTPGQLSLADVRTPSGKHAYVPYVTLETVHEAQTLLHHLLTLHRCVVSVELNGYVFAGYIQLVCDSLCASPNLRKLTLCLPQLTPQTSHSFAAILPHLHHLQELDVTRVVLDRTVLEGLSEFLASTGSLTTLLMDHVPNQSQEAALVLLQLHRNATIKTLSLCSCMVGPPSSPCGILFAKYMRKNKTLHTLSVVSCHGYAFEEIPHLVKAIINSNALSVLNLLNFWVDARSMDYIARLLRGCKVLTSFNTIGCLWYESAPEHGAGMNSTENYGSVTPRIDPWLAALRGNNTLDQITLDLSWFNREECWALLKALALHASIKKVIVTRIRCEDAEEVCRAIRGSGILQRLTFRESHATHDPVVTISKCKELSFVCLDSTVYDDLNPLRTTLCLLRSSSHVSSLCLTVGLLNSEVSTLMAKCISSTKVLRRLWLFFSGTDTGNAVDRPERALFRALSVNKSIRSLFIKGPCFDETETGVLADTLTSGRTVSTLSFCPEDFRSALSLVQQLLSRDFSANYALTDMRLTSCDELGGDWFAISNVVRRNDSLVKRATQFVEGTSSHKYCAAALELVPFNSTLVAAVERSASVDTNEAVLQIQRRLKSFSEMDDFMRMAGVVKESVACYERDDCQTQLVDLNRDCWLHLRQFLKLSNILDEEPVRL